MSVMVSNVPWEGPSCHDSGLILIDAVIRPDRELNAQLQRFNIAADKDLLKWLPAQKIGNGFGIMTGMRYVNIDRLLC